MTSLILTWSAADKDVSKRAGTMCDQLAFGLKARAFVAPDIKTLVVAAGRFPIDGIRKRQISDVMELVNRQLKMHGLSDDVQVERTGG